MVFSWCLRAHYGGHLGTMTGSRLNHLHNTEKHGELTRLACRDKRKRLATFIGDFNNKTIELTPPPPRPVFWKPLLNLLGNLKNPCILNAQSEPDQGNNARNHRLKAIDCSVLMF